MIYLTEALQAMKTSKMTAPKTQAEAIKLKQGKGVPGADTQCGKKK